MPTGHFVRTKEHCQNISKAQIGNKYGLGTHRIFSDKTKEKMRMAKLGTKASEATKLKHRLRKGELSGNWKEGVSPIQKRIRRSIDFFLWRQAIFSRDNFTCQKTGKRGVNLHPHHIKNFAEFPELRFAIDNGITLSAQSHKEFHSKYGRRNNTIEQLKEFLIKK